MGYEFHKATVLIVEDNKPMIELIRSIVDMFGFRQVHTATNGDEGYEKFCEHNPDLIISDWAMEPTNGIEMAHKIRQNASSPNKYVPIILLTGFSQKQRVIEARDIGITEFVVKPFKVIDLYKRIENIIEIPRKFVDSNEFFGPDRRRKRDANYEGPHRRQADEFLSKNNPLKKQDIKYKQLMKEQKKIEDNAKKHNDLLIIDFEERDDD